jgi:hypothetical protein
MRGAERLWAFWQDFWSQMREWADVLEMSPFIAMMFLGFICAIGGHKAIEWVINTVMEESDNE